MAAPYKPRKPGSLKEAIALLVEHCGGQTAVAPLLRCKPQHVARLTDDLHPTAIPRVDQILLLEARCGDPVVTRFMAAARNCIVEPVECAHHEPLPLVMGRITKETGELLSAAAAACASGRLTPTQAGTVLRETNDVFGAMAQLRTECRHVIEQEAA